MSKLRRKSAHWLFQYGLCLIYPRFGSRAWVVDLEGAGIKLRTSVKSIKPLCGLVVTERFAIVEGVDYD